MSDAPALTRLIILRDRTLPYADLDLRDPVTDLPLSELCLIGPNGIGKSVILSRLYEAVGGASIETADDEGYILAKYQREEDEFYLAKKRGNHEVIAFHASIESHPSWLNLPHDPPPFEALVDHFADELWLEPITDGSSTTLWLDSERCLVNGSPAEDLPSFLGSRLREREDAFHRFLRAPEHRDLTIAEVEEVFEKRSPYALPLLRTVWNRLLEPAALGVDFSMSESPFRTTWGAPLPMERLGHSLRRVLLRTGLAFAGSPHDEQGKTLFLDHPEEGLHPELALQLIPLYRMLPGATPPTLFVATQSPFVAAAFAPAQRFCLQITSSGDLSISRGIAAEGASSEEILRTDFGVTPDPVPSLNSHDNRYSKLKRAIRESEDQDELADLIDEVISIRRY